MIVTDDTVHLVWKGVIGTDRMCRYYGYLAVRLKWLGELLAIGTVSFSAGAVLTLLTHLPEWATAVTAAAAAVANLVLVIGRFQEKAARSADIRRQLTRLSTEWQNLWSDIYQREDAEVRESWSRLAQRQGEVLQNAPVDLPLSKPLARRSEREADLEWTTRYASS